MDEYCLGYKGAKPSGNVSIMENTKIICHGAFEDCSSITFVHFPNSVYYLQIGNNAFSGCTGITSVSIPDTGVSIGDEAFSGCTGLTTINFFKNTIIGNHAFSGCTGLTTVTLSSSIGKYAFSGCTGLASINFSNPNPNYPYGGISIGECAFSGCIGISSVTIPDYIASIGDYVFQNCSGLKEINFKANCTMDASNAWYGCSDISLNIDSVTIIERLYWNNCDALSSISIGNTVITINEGAFASCHNLTTLIIGKSVKSIGKEAFAYNPRLNMVYYNVEKDLEAPAPYSANDNGNTAFYNCPNLTTIHIGPDVQEIGSNIFKGCNTVHFVVALGPTPAVLDAGAFSDIVDNSVLMVSCGKRVTYYSVWNMFPFNNIIEDCNQYTVSVGVNGTGGNVTSSATNAQMGQTIIITITPNPGMTLSSISVVNANDPTQIIPITPMGKSASNYSFVMPPFEVVVMATFTTANTSVEENTVVSVPASVYPNPTTGMVKVEAEDLKHISINNMLGQQIYNGKVSGNEFEYNFNKHGAGLYLIRIETSSGVAVKKVSVR